MRSKPLRAEPLATRATCLTKSSPIKRAAFRIMQRRSSACECIFFPSLLPSPSLSTLPIARNARVKGRRRRARSEFSISRDANERTFIAESAHNPTKRAKRNLLRNPLERAADETSRPLNRRREGKTNEGKRKERHGGGKRDRKLAFSKNRAPFGTRRLAGGGRGRGKNRELFSLSLSLSLSLSRARAHAACLRRSRCKNARADLSSFLA